MLAMPNVPWIHSIPDVAGKMGIQQGYPSAARTDSVVFLRQLCRMRAALQYRQNGLGTTVYFVLRDATLVGLFGVKYRYDQI